MLLHLQRVKIRCSLRNKQNTSGVPGLIPQNGCTNSVFQTPHLWHERLMDLLQCDRLKMFLGCSNQKEVIYQLEKSQAPEVLWTVISARENNAIANKFTWPSSTSGGFSREMSLRAEVPTPCLLPRYPWWEKWNADRSLQGLSLDCARPPWSASILLFYLWGFSLFVRTTSAEREQP